MNRGAHPFLCCLFCAATVVAAGAPPRAFAGPGADAFAAGDYKRAQAILEPQARRGQAEAQYLLGRMRESGLGLPADRERARYWYSLAAAQGHVAARGALEAFDAQTPTPAPAPPKPVPAATSGDVAAATPAPVSAGPLGDAQRLQAMLAGRLPTDTARAAAWARGLAPQAEAGESILAVLLGEYFESRLGGEDFAAAAHWYSRAAEAGQPVAQNNLGAMYYDGRGVLQSYAEAERLYTRAAEAGHRVAQFNLALMLGQGRAGKPDPRGMLEWLQKSSAQGYARAQAQLARFRLDGTLLPADPREAAQLFRLAAEQGLPMAQYWFGRALSRGEGVPRDLEAGATWIMRAADQGHVPAMVEAGRILEMGLGLVSDNARALAYYRRAAAAGDTEAAARLARGDLPVGQARPAGATGERR
jgi:TPR repeat protein